MKSRSSQWRDSNQTSSSQPQKARFLVTPKTWSSNGKWTPTNTMKMRSTIWSLMWRTSLWPRSARKETSRCGTRRCFLRKGQERLCRILWKIITFRSLASTSLKGLAWWWLVKNNPMWRYGIMSLANFVISLSWSQRVALWRFLKISHWFPLLASTKRYISIISKEMRMFSMLNSRIWSIFASLKTP